MAHIEYIRQASRDAQYAKRDIQAPFCHSRPASVPLRHTSASSALATQHYGKWLDGVSDAYAASPLVQGTTGMLRAAYAYCGLPAFVSLSMAGSDE